MTTSTRTTRRLNALMDTDPFSLSPEEREVLYNELRDLMQEHYQKVTSRALTKRRRYIKRRRAAGTKVVRGRAFEDDHHTRHADEAEKQLEDDVSTYFGDSNSVGAQHFKYILAILTGRYDTRFWGEDGEGVKRIPSDNLDTLKAQATLTRAREQGYTCWTSK